MFTNCDDNNNVDDRKSRQTPPTTFRSVRSSSIKALPKSYNYRKLRPMSFASLINLYSQQFSLSRSFRKSSRSSYNPSVKWKSSEKKFHSAFRGLCPWSVLIFLSSRHPLLLPCVLLYLSVPAANRFPIWLSWSFCIPVSGEWRVGEEWFLKCLKDRGIVLPALYFLFFVCPLFISCCLYSIRRHPLPPLIPPCHFLLPREFAHGLVLSR